MKKESTEITQTIEKVKKLATLVNFGFVFKDALGLMLDDIYKLCDEIKEK